nr:extracellular solute-binding protein [uncultured Sphaerochaeta sp.]
MATIKDIAKLAGVSQGTVSNVLNGRGNVSSSKILLVEKAAETLQYRPNERAKLLRKGSSKTIALVLPNQQDQQYIDFQISFSSYVEHRGFSIELYYSEDNPEREKKLLARIKATMASSIATFTSLGHQAESFYRAYGYTSPSVLFVGRNGGSPFIGFDYLQAAQEIASYCSSHQYHNICILIEENTPSDELFYTEMDRILGSVSKVPTNLYSRRSKIFEVFETDVPQLIIATNIGVARLCKSIQKGFFTKSMTEIIPLAPFETLPSQEFKTTYELNYRYLGRRAAELIVQDGENGQSFSTMLPSDGFRSWAIPRRSACSLRMLGLATPYSRTLQSFAEKYSRETGVKIEVEIANYERMNEVLVDEQKASQFDILRIGADVLSWDAETILRPLDEIDCDVEHVFSSLLKGIEQPFSWVRGRRYAVPLSPSLQILFYRKDMFEKHVIRRIYQERYHTPLEVPETFSEYNRIARFFTKTYNTQSPLSYGTTLALGSTPILAGTEFITRYFSYAPSLFYEGDPALLSDEAEKALHDLLALRNCTKRPVTWWTQAAKDFANGETAMTILFSNFASEFFGRNSLVSDKIGFSMIPGSRPLLGGGSLGVSKWSKNPEEALAFITWLVSDPVASAVSLFGGNPITQSVGTNYEVIETYPWMEVLSHGFSQPLGQRTPTSHRDPFNDHRFMNLLGNAVWSCWYDGLSAKRALSNAYTTYLRERDLYSK